MMGMQWDASKGTYVPVPDPITPEEESAYIATRDATDAFLRASRYVRGDELDALETTVAAKADASAVMAVETAVERVDPGTTGSVGQALTIGPSGPAWLDEPVFNVRHPRFGATGVQADNQTAAVQAAVDAAVAAGGGTVFFPAGTYTVTGLTIAGKGVRFEGVSRRKSLLRCSPGTLLTLTGADEFACEHLALHASGGHIVTTTTDLTHTFWHDLLIIQFSTGYSVLNVDDGGAGTFDYIDNAWSHVDVTHSLSATVPTFNLRGGAINRNLWTDIRPTYSGNYVWKIETTAPSAYASGNVIQNITGEVLNGGIVQLLGARGTLLSNVELYDIGTTTRDLIDIGPSTVTTTLESMGTTLLNVRRVGGTLGGGKYDVVLRGANSVTDTVLINCGFSPTGLQVNANSKRCTVIDGTAVTVTNNSGTQRLASDLSGSRFVSTVTFRDGIVLPKFTTAARPSASTSGEGMMIYDTTLDKPLWSDGTNWKDATGAVA